MMGTESVQEKLYIYQVMKSRIEELEEQIKLLNEALEDAAITGYCIDELKKIDNPVFPTIGNSMFYLGDGKVLVGIGAGVLVKKTLDEAKEIMEKRRKKLEETLDETSKRIEKIQSDLERLEKELGLR